MEFQLIPFVLTKVFHTSNSMRGSRSYRECREFCEEYRKRKAIKKLLNSQKEQKGHGRNPIPEDMPRLEERYFGLKAI